jgi:hypothetical protein
LRNAQLRSAGFLALFRQGHLCCQRWYLCLSRGGFDGSANQVHNDLLRFDLAINSWTSLASSPDQHFLSQAVIFNGKIYNIGGFDGGGGVSNTTRIDDIASDSWITGAPLPVALTDMATALWNGSIFTWPAASTGPAWQTRFTPTTSALTTGLHSHPCRRRWLCPDSFYVPWRFQSGPLQLERITR